MDPNEEYLPGFEKIQDPLLDQKQESRTNLIVFVIVLLGVLPFLIWGHWFLRTPSENHFLISVPLTSFKFLEPVKGIGGEIIPGEKNTLSPQPGPPSQKILPNGLPVSMEFVEKSFFIILWGPWEDASCDLIHQIWPFLQEAQKNPKFQVIPIAYFSHASEPIKWDQMSQEERQQYIKQREEVKKRLGQYVQNSFRNGFSFPVVWWDPTDRFRQDLIDQSIVSDPKRKNQRVISTPTIIFAEKGVITKVWTSNSPEDLAEIEETLKIVAFSAPNSGSGNAPDPAKKP